MFKRLLLSAAFAAVLSSGTYAETKTDWTGQLDGLDGVTIACGNANTEKYAAGICADMRKRTLEKFSSAGIRTTDLGDYFVKDVDRPANPPEMAAPLDITIFVRGTNSDSVYAINLRNQISVRYEKAVEEGASGAGRKGDLLMWEGSTTGSGPRKQLSAAIAGASFQKLEEQIDEIIRLWPK